MEVYIVTVVFWTAWSEVFTDLDEALAMWLYDSRLASKAGASQPIFTTTLLQIVGECK